MHFTIEVGAKLALSPLPHKYLLEQIREALTVRRMPTPDQDAYYKCLMEQSDKFLYMPRGFMTALLLGLEANGHTYTLRDYTDSKKYEYELGSGPINMRPHQEEAVQQILDAKEGVIVAPPAAGKTVLALEAIRRSRRRALIIVDKQNLLTQWNDRCYEFLGIHPTLLGGNQTFSGDICITIAMQQSLSRDIEMYYDDYGFVCLDECHHVTADTYLEVFQRYNAEYRIGLSATPYRDDGLELISRLVIGEVIYSVDAETLLRDKYIIRPRIERTRTTFKHSFWGTHYVHGEICDVPNCKKIGTKHGHKNNYMKVTNALITDPARRDQVADDVVNNINYCNMIVSDRLEHLREMREACILKGFPAERTYMLTGKETPKERAEVTRLAGYGACAIFSTIAKEALDIPRLDRLYLTWPIRKTHILEQQIGRITRTHPDKREAVVYDYVDEGCSVLANQAWDRFTHYRQKNYNIKEK